MNVALPKIRKASSEIGAEKCQSCLPRSFGGRLVGRALRMGKGVIRWIPTQFERLPCLRHSGREALYGNVIRIRIAFREATQNWRLQTFAVDSRKICSVIIEDRCIERRDTRRDQRSFGAIRPSDRRNLLGRPCIRFQPIDPGYQGFCRSLGSTIHTTGQFLLLGQICRGLAIEEIDRKSDEALRRAHLPHRFRGIAEE